MTPVNPNEEERRMWPRPLRRPSGTRVLGGLLFVASFVLTLLAGSYGRARGWPSNERLVYSSLAFWSGVTLASAFALWNRKDLS